MMTPATVYARLHEEINALPPDRAIQALRYIQQLQEQPLQRHHPALQQEIEAFEQLKPQLLQTHPGQYVAVYQGHVIAAGNDKMELLGQVWETFGDIICYIEKVEAETPRRVRMPSVWVKRHE